MKSVSGWYQYSQLIWLIRVADNFIWLYCIFICIVDFGDNGVHTDLIYLDNFWSENVIYDEYFFVGRFTFSCTLFLAPVATHGHSTS